MLNSQWHLPWFWCIKIRQIFWFSWGWKTSALNREKLYYLDREGECMFPVQMFCPTVVLVLGRSTTEDLTPPKSRGSFHTAKKLPRAKSAGKSSAKISTNKSTRFGLSCWTTPAEFQHCPQAKTIWTTFFIPEKKTIDAWINRKPRRFHCPRERLFLFRGNYCRIPEAPGSHWSSRTIDGSDCKYMLAAILLPVTSKRPVYPIRLSE